MAVKYKNSKSPRPVQFVDYITDINSRILYKQEES